ncbi:MAG TPA: hypothetical protein C5S37_13310 [Methanophagales archaeon]|nr:hypothetical protein [Methanophagales archaeon]
MKHENSESKKEVTLDTSSLINWRDQKRDYLAVKEIIDLHEQGVIDVKVTTRLAFDQRNFPNEKEKEKLVNFSKKVGIIPSFFRYGTKEIKISTYGSISNHSSGDGYGSIESVEMEKKLTKIMFGVESFDVFTKETTKYRKIADVDHLLAHIIEKRDYFVTSDEKDFIKNGKREKLKSEFGVEIMTPEDFVKMWENM